ncbi:hypothetical protein RhiJN_07994 [Ceratobasidium sp. AG-Ba]|nr:hypothetical protein RhiJN_07994 [Ceratobasidium sp. AG-Ba]
MPVSYARFYACLAEASAQEANQLAPGQLHSTLPPPPPVSPMPLDWSRPMPEEGPLPEFREWQGAFPGAAWGEGEDRESEEDYYLRGWDDNLPEVNLDQWAEIPSTGWDKKVVTPLYPHNFGKMSLEQTPGKFDVWEFQ